MSILSLRLFLLVISFIQLIQNAYAAPGTKDAEIYTEQKKRLDTFKANVKDKLTKEYMTEDIYLVRWLRAKSFKIADAEKMLLDNLAWRERNKMDTIMEEDFSDFTKEFPYTITTYTDGNRTGVVAYFDIGLWDIRSSILQGKQAKGIRYMDRYLEEVTSKVRNLQAEGANITQFDLILNLEDFNMVQQGCIQCVSAVTSFLSSYENHYPNSCNKMYLINAPKPFETVLNNLKVVLSKITKDALQVYGTNKEEWQSKLFEDIPPEYLNENIGGKLARSSKP